MSEYLLKKNYVNHFGIDLKSSDLTRQEGFASSLNNCQYRKSGSIEKRKGFQAHAASQGGYGLFTYNRINNTTGAEEPEVLCVSNNLYKLQNSTLSVTYAGSDPTCLLSIFYDTETSQYRCQILEGSTLVVDMPLGLGFDESSTVTIDDLKTTIDSVADFTASVSGETTTPASFIEIVRTFDLTATNYSGIASYWEQINSTVTNPFAGSETNKNDLNFENVSATQLNNIIYFSNGYDDIQKYDGQTVYRAGLPTPSSVSSAIGAAGSITGSNYQHVIRYVQKDNSGNFIEGNDARSNVISSATSEQIDVTVANIQASTGFNTNCAIANGAQSGVTTITVDNGSGGAHTLKQGDTAYFYDGVIGAYVERTVTAVTSTTIAISGAAVDVSDNDVISNNLRIEIYRNKTSATSPPTAFFLVDEIPNNSFASTQAFTDNLADASLGAQYVEPLTDRSPPPKGKYISQFRNQTVVTGNIENPNTVYYADVDGPEYFPANTNQFECQTTAGDPNTGIAPNNEVFAVFKQKSIFIVSGNISDGTIRVDQLTNDIGCEAHASIQEIRGSLFFLSDRGPYQMTGGQLPTSLGEFRIEPVFDDAGLTDELNLFLFGTTIVDETHAFRLKRSVGFNDRENQRYVLYVPCEGVQGGDRYSNSNSKLFVFDYIRQAWLIWDNLNWSGGVTMLNDEIYWIERRYSTFNSTVDHILWRRHNLQDAWDYQDHNASISFDYSPQWEAFGEPSVLQRILKIRFFDLEELRNNDLNLTVRVEHNFIRDVPEGEFTLQFSGDGYGTAPYGTSPYGNPAESALTHTLSKGRIRSHRFRFLNSMQQENVIITGWETEAALPYKPRFKD